MTDRKTDDDRIEDKQAEGHEPPTREDLNDTGEGMPVNLGSGGYGGTAKTVEKEESDSKSKDR